MATRVSRESQLPDQSASLPSATAHARAARPGRRKLLRWSLLTSFVIHLALVPLWLAAVGAGIPAWINGRPEAASIDTRISAESLAEFESPAIIERHETPPGVPAELDEAERLPDALISQLISQRIKQQNQVVDREQATTDLQEMASRLQSISSDENIGAITNRIGAAMGLSSPAKVAQESATDPDAFDHSTAQLHDVSRAADADGNTQYIALMVDARGLRMEVPLDEAEGRELSRLFQLMRDFPFLEKVYRSVVIGMVDRLLQDSTPQRAVE